MKQYENVDSVASLWERWCGETRWSILLREFGSLGGKIEYWCGVPQSASAIPLTFELMLPDGSIFQAPDEGNSRLKDIRAAISEAKEQAQ